MAVLQMMCATLALLLSGAGPAGVPQAFGAVGSSVGNSDKVSGLRVGPCAPSDCEILTQDGSRWTIFGDIVTRQRYLRAEAGVRLPFGLYSIIGREEALSTIRRVTGVNLLRSHSENSYSGLVRLGDDTPAILYVRLDAGGSVEEIGITLGETG